MSFFSRYGLAKFKFDDEEYTLQDLTKRVVNFPDFVHNNVYLEDFYIEPGMRPDHLAIELYSDVNYWWVFFIVNNISENDWPLDDTEIEELVDDRYTPNEQNRYSSSNTRSGRFIWDETTIVNEDGSETRIDHYNAIRNIDTSFNRYFWGLHETSDRNTLKEDLIAQNDEKRQIRVPRVQFIQEFVKDFNARINGKVFS